MTVNYGKNFLILDLETTGLDPVADKICEVAWTTTKGDLKFPMTIFSRVVTPYGDMLDRIEANDVVKHMHTESGLLDALTGEGTKRLSAIEDEILDHLDRRSKDGETWHLVGASIHFDQRYIERYMPRLFRRLHHRMLDTSSVKLFLGSVNIEIDAPLNDNPHRAANDVREAVEWLHTAQKWAIGRGVAALGDDVAARAADPKRMRGIY